MIRRVELGAALLATVLGLIWLTSVARAVEGSAMIGSLNAGGGPAPSISTMVSYCVLMGFILIALSLGAYLHAQRGVVAGITILWAAGILLIVGLVLYLFAPLAIMPATLAFLLTQADWLTPIVSVLVAMLTGIAAVAAVTPPHSRLSSAAR